MIYHKTLFLASLLFQYATIDAKEGCPDFGSTPLSVETQGCFTSCNCRGILQCVDYRCEKPDFGLTKPFCHDHISLVGVIATSCSQYSVNYTLPYPGRVPGEMHEELCGGRNADFVSNPDDAQYLGSYSWQICPECLICQFAPTGSPTTPQPTTSPSVLPSQAPSVDPSVSPTQMPTTTLPTTFPTPSLPTTSPTTSNPSALPTTSPTISDPSVAPTQMPTTSPTISDPSVAPTQMPTTTLPSTAPTPAMPTVFPTASPVTSLPTVSPTKNPSSSFPSASPTNTPTEFPTFFPSITPTEGPTAGPTSTPTMDPTISMPTTSPITSIPTHDPTVSMPTTSPSSSIPTASPSDMPTDSPTNAPTEFPTRNPTTSIPTPIPTDMPSESPTSAPTQMPTMSPATSLPTKNPTESPTLSPTKATKLIIIDMECPADLVSFEKELVTELTKSYPDVEVSAVKCGSVKITLMHMNDDMDELDECLKYIADEGLSLPSYGMVGGKEVEEDSASSAGFPVWGVVLLCLAILGLIAGGVYFHHEHMQKNKNEEKLQNVIQVSHGEPVASQEIKTPGEEVTKKQTRSEIPRVSLSENVKEILKEDKQPWKPRTQPIEDPSVTIVEGKNNDPSTDI